MFIEATYYDIATGDLEKAQRACEVWARIYPRDSIPPTILGVIYASLGQTEKSLEEYRKALQFDSDSSLIYEGIVFRYLDLNRFDEARAAAEEAKAKKLDVSYSFYALDFLLGDAAGMAQQVAGAMGKPGAEDSFLRYEADTSAYSGQLGKAREFFRHATSSAQRADEKRDGDELRSRSSSARGPVRQCLGGATTGTGADRAFNGGVLAIPCGASTCIDRRFRPGPGLNDLDNRFPENTIVRFNYLPMIRAQIALSHHDAPEAIEFFNPRFPMNWGLMLL